MATLKYVGEFQELGYDDRPHAMSVHDSRGKRGPDINSPGSDDDVFDATKRAGSASVMTDGVYV